jgi:uncharacterized protein YecA (UPF0149 family)
MILRVSVRPVEQTEQRQDERQQRVSQGTASGAGLERGPSAPPTKKPGRNDPCWCGSGKKYKKCHGA